jgi:hypothetical protein
MRRIFATAALGALLWAAPALADGSAGTIPSIDASCPAAGGSTIQGTLLRSAATSLTMTVDSGSGPMLAFGAAHLLLPVAPNATFVGSPRRGDTVVVQVFACPNADKTAVTMVAGRIALKSWPAARPTPHKPVAVKKRSAR